MGPIAFLLRLVELIRFNGAVFRMHYLVSLAVQYNQSEYMECGGEREVQHIR